MANIFREALEILDNKNGDMAEEKEGIMSAAMIPLIILPQFNDMYLRKGLEELAKIVEEAQ